MKHPALPSTLALVGLLAACGGGDDNVAPVSVPDAFVASVATNAAVAADDTDPVNIDSIAVTLPEDTDPDPVT